MDNYLDNVEAFCNKHKLRDPLTDEEMNPDEKLMRSIEEQIGISENAKKSFREEILIRISAFARKGKKFDYHSHENLREAIQKRSEEHTSELQSRGHLVCRLLLEKKKTKRRSGK